MLESASFIASSSPPPPSYGFTRGGVSSGVIGAAVFAAFAQAVGGFGNSGCGAWPPVPDAVLAGGTRGSGTLNGRWDKDGDEAPVL